MSKINNDEKIIINMVVETVKQIKKFNTKKFAYKNDNENTRILISSEDILSISTREPNNSGIIINHYNLKSDGEPTISLEIFNHSIGYKDRVEVNKNEDPETFDQLIETINYIDKLKYEHRSLCTKDILHDIIKNL